MRAWLQFRSRNPAERRLLVEAAVFDGLIWIGLRTLPFASVRRTLDRFATRTSQGQHTPLPLIAWAVNAAARRLPGRHTCLMEALAADVMLRRRGYRSELHFGLRRRTGGSHTLDGHAWVTCGNDVVVGDVENLADYACCVISCPPV